MLRSNSGADTVTGPRTSLQATRAINLQNLSVSFERKGSSMIDALVECVAKNEKRYKNFKPTLDKDPDAIKDKI